MRFKNVITGSIISAIGLGIGYIDYYIISIYYYASLWISGLINAPEAVASLLTILLIFMSLGIIVVIAVLALYILCCGLAIMIDDYYYH